MIAARLIVATLVSLAIIVAFATIVLFRINNADDDGWQE